MSEIQCDYSIRFSLPSSLESPATIGAKFVATLDALSGIDPVVFENWELVDFSAEASLPLAEVRSHVSAIIERNVSRDQLGNPAPCHGYTVNAFTATAIKSCKNNTLGQRGREYKNRKLP